jgi:hypothetical protein
LDAKSRRVKNEQYPREYQQVVYGAVDNILPVDYLLDGKKCKKSKSRNEKPDKTVGKNDSQIIPYHTGKYNHLIFYVVSFTHFFTVF